MDIKTSISGGKMKSVISTKYGSTQIEFRPDLAPNHCKVLDLLIRGGFYDGLQWHRVVPGFVAQTGSPMGADNSCGISYLIGAEFSQEPFVLGSVGMARAQDLNSASSQFFICLSDTACRCLDGQYTWLGKVTQGMEYIQKLVVKDRTITMGIL